MATLFSQLPSESTGTNIRVWSQFVEDVLVLGGWEITDDTGQTLPSSLPAPTAANQKLGYRIYRTTDGFFQVYMRIDFGSGTAFQYTPPPYSQGFWITIGTDSDGGGGITGVMLNSLQSNRTTVDQVGLLYNSYGCADKGRCALLVATLGFSLERSKNELGEDTGDGLLFTSSDLYGDSFGVHHGLGNSAYLVPDSVQPPINTGLNYYHTTNDPSPIFMGHKGVGVVFHFRGTAQQPGLNWLIVNAGDMGSGSQVNVNIYGQTHRYQHVGQYLIPLVGLIQEQPSAQADMRTDDLRRLLMRWE